jgi:5-methylcytosine-specific restriction endonuclease McrA
MLTVDHIVPRHHGVDRNNSSNLQLLCYRCHRVKDQLKKCLDVVNPGLEDIRHIENTTREDLPIQCNRN